MSAAFGGAWREIVGCLRKVPIECPDLIGEAVCFFDAVGVPTAECSSFCAAALRSKLPSNSRDLTAVVSLIDKLRLKRPEIENALLERASSLDTRTATARTLLDILSKSFADSSRSKAFLFDLAASSRAGAKEAAFRVLPAMKLDKKELSRCIALLADERSRGNAANWQNCVAAFNTSLRRHPHKLVGRVEADASKRLITLLKSSDPSAFALAFRLLLTGVEDVAGADVKAWLDLAENDTHRRILLAALAFVDVNQSERGPIEKPLEKAPRYSGLSRVGLVSYALRSSKAPPAIQPLIRGAKNPAWQPDPGYLFSWTSSRDRWLEAPETWRKRWSELHVSLRGPLVRSIPAFPDSKETPWLVEQALKEKELQIDLFGALWRLRSADCDLSALASLRTFLEERAGNAGNPYQALKATCMLKRFFKLEPKLDGIIASGVKKDPFLFKVWTGAVESVLEVSPRHPILKQFRSSLAGSGSGIQHQPGAPFFVWLLDLAAGKAVKKPPIEDLFDTIRRANASPVPWIQWLPTLGEKIDPWLDDLRSTHLLFAVDSPRSDRLSEYVGMLDRLEMLKRRRKQKSP